MHHVHHLVAVPIITWIHTYPRRLLRLSGESRQTLAEDVIESVTPRPCATLKENPKTRLSWLVIIGGGYQGAPRLLALVRLTMIPFSKIIIALSMRV
jgi:hypothetical protein